MAVTPDNQHSPLLDAPWDTLTLDQKIDWLAGRVNYMARMLEHYQPLLEKYNRVGSFLPGRKDKQHG